jgi:hypothetical protein
MKLPRRTSRLLARLALLLAALSLATAMLVGAMALLPGISPKAAPLLATDQASAVQRGSEAAGGSSPPPTPAVVLVFAGIVLMAALPPSAPSASAGSPSDVSRVVRGWFKSIPAIVLILVSVLCIALARRMVERAVRRIPQPHRDRYEDEWMAELEYLGNRQFLALWMAIGILLTARRTAQARRLDEQDDRPRLSRLTPLTRALVAGTLSGIVNLANFAASAYPRFDTRPTVLQLCIAAFASLLSGCLVSWQAIWQGVKDRSRRIKKD